MSYHYKCGKCQKTKEQKWQKPVPKCCGGFMEEVTGGIAPVVVTFDSLAKKVADELGANYNGSYCKSVIDFLKTNADAQKFKGDFESEMRKGTELKKFAGKSPRANIADKICFDNALRNAGFEPPPGFTWGEKFDFEIPYIMDYGEWTYMAVFQGNQPFSVKFPDFLATVQAGYQYMVATRQTSAASIGHMICITINADGESGWIYDPQKQPMKYTDWVCEAWESSATGGKSLDPKCTLDVATGERGNFPKT